MCSQLFSTFQLSLSVPQTLQCRSPSSLGPFMIMWSPPLPNSKSRIHLFVSTKVAPKLLATHSSLLFAVQAHRNITPTLLKKPLGTCLEPGNFVFPVFTRWYTSPIMQASILDLLKSFVPISITTASECLKSLFSITHRSWSTLIPGKHSTLIFRSSAPALLIMDSTINKHISPTSFTITVSQFPKFFHFLPAVTTPPTSCFSVSSLQSEFERLSVSVLRSTSVAVPFFTHRKFKLNFSAALMIPPATRFTLNSQIQVPAAATTQHMHNVV